MKKKILGIVIFILLISNATTFALEPFNQDEQRENLFLKASPTILPSKRWIKTFGGMEDDNGFSVQQTTDEGYIIAGSTESFGAGDCDVWLIKTDENGDMVWNRTFGGSAYDSSASVQLTNDGGYVVIGYTWSSGAGSDVWLIKTDDNGTQSWNRTFGGIRDDKGYSIWPTIDFGYIIVGETWSLNMGGDVWMIKTDVNGNEQWNKTFGGVKVDHGYAIQQTIDEGYIIAGSTESFGAGDFDVWLIKTDAEGNEMWDKTFGRGGFDQGLSVQQTTDGGYIITGSQTDSSDGRQNVWLIKTDTNGNEQWNTTFGGTQDDYGYAVQQTADAGYILVGETWASGAGGEVWLIKVNADGERIWDKTYGGTYTDWGVSIQQTTDEGYIITGSTMSFGAEYQDVLLIKTDENGTISDPPSTPAITGDTQGRVGVSTNYYFHVIDPDDDEVYYFIDWGDTTNSSWIGPYFSGEQVPKTHTWITKGNYTIRAKAKDTYGFESDWGTLVVTMPMSIHSIFHHFIDQLRQQFPHAFLRLQQRMAYYRMSSFS